MKLKGTYHELLIYVCLIEAFQNSTLSEVLILFQNSAAVHGLPSSSLQQVTGDEMGNHVDSF